MVIEKGRKELITNYAATARTTNSVPTLHSFNLLYCVCELPSITNASEKGEEMSDYAVCPTCKAVLQWVRIGELVKLYCVRKVECGWFWVMEEPISKKEPRKDE